MISNNLTLYEQQCNQLNFLLLILVFCAIVSHPADTIVSYMNKAQGATVGSAARDLGFSGMWAGLGPRIIMIGTLTALQWFIYDGVKVIFWKVLL